MKVKIQEIGAKAKAWVQTERHGKAAQSLPQPGSLKSTEQGRARTGVGVEVRDRGQAKLRNGRGMPKEGC